MKNNIKICLLSAILFLAVPILYGQSLDHESWRLSKKEELKDVKATDAANYPYHYLKLKVNEHLFLNPKTQNVNKYIATHAIININSKKGIDKFKSLYQTGSQEFFQYRIIKANGEVLDKSDDDDKDKNEQVYNFNFTSISDITNFDFSRFLGGNTKIAGLDTNCQLEYILVTKKSYLSGEGDKYGAEFIQKEVPIYNFEFNLIVPDYLEFKTDEFNGCPAPDADESDDKNYITYELDHIPAFEKSAITATSANKMGFLFVWYKNTSSSKTNIVYEYSTYSRFFYEEYMKENATNTKIVSKYLKANPQLNNKTGLERIELLDLTIKQDFRTSYGGISLKDAIKEKRLSSKSRLLLYTTILNSWGEKFELVNPTSRRYLPFLEKYDNPLYIESMQIYIPKYDAYVSPDSKYNPVNLMPSSYRENKAIFTKKKGVQGFSSGGYYIDTIYPLEYKLNKNYSKYIIDVANKSVAASHSLGGWQGLPYWNELNDVNHEKLEDLFKGLSKNRFKDAILLSSNLNKVDEIKSPLSTPIEMQYSFKSKSLMNAESASSKVINIGAFINDAKHLQEKPKNNGGPDIYSGYEKIKEIEILIPQGYKVGNLNELNSAKKFNAGTVTDAMSHSIESKVDGNKLIITVTEIFKQGKYSAADMDNFLEVYNAGWNLKDLQVKLIK